MKKILYLILLIPFIFITDVKANTINSITMDIYIDKNGNAHITETWDAYLSEGTEGYRSYGNLGNSKISNFEVSENGITYTTLNNWNINASFSDKAYKAGINDKGNIIELCWGISWYGNHQYQLNYEISGFIAEIDDSQIIYWELLPRDLDTNNVYIKIHADERFSDELPVWGYGNYGGYAHVHDGYIEMSNNSLESNEYMTILVKFDKGTFNTSNIVGNDFNYYYEMAEEGSKDFNYIIDKIISFFKTIGNLILIFMLLIGENCIYIILIIISIIFTFKKSKKSKFKFGKKGNKVSKNVEMFRDLPCEGNIYRAYWVAYNYDLMDDRTDFLGVILLKWIKEKKIKFKTKKTLFKKENIFIFKPDITQFDVDIESTLYKYLYSASIDGVLEENELKKWCEENFIMIISWFEMALNITTNSLIFNGKVIKNEVNGISSYHVNEIMKEEANQLMGLKKYFKEFKNMKEKTSLEVNLYEEYLLYAQLLGVADKVAKEFKKLYPEAIKVYNFDNIDFIHDIIPKEIKNSEYYRTDSPLFKAVNSILDSSLSSGIDYSSGGGGRSSGGGGGGSFGGGGSGGFR